MIAETIAALKQKMRPTSPRHEPPKRANLATYIKSFAAREERVAHRPLEVFASLTTVCDTRCVICPQFSGDFRWHRSTVRPPLWDGDRIMSDETLAALDPLLELAAVVHPFGVGEPTVHPRFLEFLERAGRTRSWIEFFTNGQSITREGARRIVGAGTRRIFFSINAASESLYADLHRGATLGRVLESMTHLRRAREESGGVLPRLFVNFVALDVNLEELPSLVYLVARHGVEGIEVKRLTPYDDRPEMKSMQRLYEPGRDEPILAAARQAADRTGVMLFLDHYSDRSEAAAASPPIAVDPGPCFFPWRSMSINSAGLVQPCCFHADTLFLGNVRDTPALAIWNGEGYRELRRRVARGDYPESCRYCLTHGQRPTRDNIADYLDDV